MPVKSVPRDRFRSGLPSVDGPRGAVSSPRTLDPWSTQQNRSHIVVLIHSHTTTLLREEGKSHVLLFMTAFANMVLSSWCAPFPKSRSDRSVGLGLELEVGFGAWLEELTAASEIMGVDRWMNGPPRRPFARSALFFFGSTFLTRHAHNSHASDDVMRARSRVCMAPPLRSAGACRLRTGLSSSCGSRVLPHHSFDG